jgi:hypothetical protein
MDNECKECAQYISHKKFNFCSNCGKKLDHSLPPAAVRNILAQNVQLEKVIFDGLNASKINEQCLCIVGPRSIEYNIRSVELQHNNIAYNMYVKNQDKTTFYQILQPPYDYRKSTLNCKCVAQSQDCCPHHGLPFVDFTFLGIRGITCDGFEKNKTITLQDFLSVLVENGIHEPRLNLNVKTTPDIVETEKILSNPRLPGASEWKLELKLDVTASIFDCEKNERQDKLDQTLDSITSDLFYSRKTKKIYLLDELNDLFKVELTIYDLNFPSNSEVFYVRNIRIYILIDEIDQLFYFIELRKKLTKTKTLKLNDHKMKPHKILSKLMGLDNELEGS